MMHVVLGEGQMTKEELVANLEDLAGKIDDGEPFWFLVQAKPEPTATDRTLMAWIADNGVYFEIVGDDLKGADKIYANAQDKHEVKKLAPKILDLMHTKPDEGEAADLLALFVDDDPDAEEDLWLNEVVQLVIEAELPVLALNDGLVVIGLDEAEEEEPEEEPVKPVSKKAAPKIAAVTEPEPEEEEWEDGGAVDLGYTREDLEEIAADKANGLAKIKEIAAVHGIVLPLRTRATTYIDRLLGEDDEGAETEVEVVPEEPNAWTQGMPSVESNGHLDIEALADAVAERIFDKLREALNS